jgi:hypothetical protein
LWFEATSGATDIWQINNGHWARSVTVGAHPLGWTPVGVGDLDHNAIPDITWQQNGTGHIEQWLLA